MEMMKFTSDRLYVGRTYRNVKETKCVRVTRRTPQFIYYEVDNGTTGRCKVNTDYNGEYFIIAKENSLYVSAANFMN